MTAMDEIGRKAKRAALTGALLETFETKDERLRFVVLFRDRSIISQQAADLLIEVYGLDR